MRSRPASSRADSALYRRVWRWHFYAGLVCLPFLALLAVTGAVYLFKDPIESLAYRQLRFVEAGTQPLLAPESLAAQAQAARAGEVVRFVAPAHAGRSAEVGIRTRDRTVSVYLDPASGHVLGVLRDDRRPMEVVKRLHSLAIAGTVANHWIEVVAGWAIVLVVSGVFLWWPRGRQGGTWRVRGRPAQRGWWRDLHAVTGVAAAAAILFLAVTGMPWSASHGERSSAGSPTPGASACRNTCSGRVRRRPLRWPAWATCRGRCARPRYRHRTCTQAMGSTRPRPAAHPQLRHRSV